MSAKRVGVIGCGGRMRSLLNLLIRHPDEATVAALVDPDGGAVEQARGIVGKDAKRYPDPQAMLDTADIDWVMIGSPNNLHREQMLAALEAGKHVYCEKPLATTVEDCAAMNEAVGRTGLNVVIGFTLRFSPHYRAIRKLIEDGAIGNLLSFEFNETLNFNHGGFMHQGQWRRRSNLAGSQLLEKCCHDMDLANWFVGGRVSRVASFGGRTLFTAANAHLSDEVGPDPDTGRLAYQAWRESAASPFTDDKDIIDHQVAILEYDNGVRAAFHHHCASAIPERRMVLIGDRGTIRADVIAGHIECQRIGWKTERQTIDAGKDARGGHGGGDPVLIAELLDVMHDRGQPGATFHDGLVSAVTCFAIDQSMTAGQVVDVNPMWQQVGLGD